VRGAVCAALHALRPPSSWATPRRAPPREAIEIKKTMRSERAVAPQPEVDAVMRQKLLAVYELNAFLFF
jgi:hypothetical protein